MDEHKQVVSPSSVQVDEVVQGLVQGEQNTIILASPQPARAQGRDRQYFLIYLCTRYRHVLEQSLQEIAFIALGLHTKPETIAHLALLVFRYVNQSERILPPRTSLTEVYDQAGGELLRHRE